MPQHMIFAKRSAQFDSLFPSHGLFERYPMPRAVFRADDGQSAPYPSLPVRARNGRVVDNSRVIDWQISGNFHPGLATKVNRTFKTSWLRYNSMESAPKYIRGQNEKPAFTVELSVWMSVWVYWPLFTCKGTAIGSGRMDMDGWKQHRSKPARCAARSLWDLGNARAR
jgi:hypothetical protein